MKPYRDGLVVGKFAPLHVGHEALINAALAQCETVYIISYSRPEIPGYDPDKCLHWLSARFPQCHHLVLTPEVIATHALEPLPHNDADADLHRHYVATLCEKILHCQPQAVFTAEDYGDGFAAVLSQRFGKQVTHVRLQRPKGPEAPSGTLIRSDVHRYRTMMSPEVYRSFVSRICLLGGESTGKSTLSRALATTLNAPFVAEFGREYWEEKNGVLGCDDLLHIAREQVRREAMASTAPFLVCDTSPLTTLFYMLDQFGSAPRELEELAGRAYSLVVLCGDEFPFVQDGTRQGAAFRQRQQAWYIRALTDRNIPYLPVSGSLAERIEQVRRHLQERI